MPTPTIPDGELFFNATLYSGNNANPRSITNGVAGQSFQPDFVWVKQRTSNGGGAASHQLYDSVRGTQKLIYSNETTAEVSSPSNGGVQSFDSNGFTIQGSSSSLNMNQTGENYVGWQWKASNAAGVSNTQGTITSTVSANTTAGFSIVTYTGSGANATIGHGLGVAPQMVIVKLRSSSGENWNCWHTSLGGNTYRILLNTTGAVDTGSPSIWSSGGINPTSTTFTVGTNSGTNGSASTFVAYCWSEIAGYSKFGSYTGNSSTDGPFIYTGFRPRFILFKNITQGSQWILLDSARNTYNVSNAYLEPNTSDAENTSTNILDMLSNGFKLRDSGGTDYNENANTYIYMAFAENPFKYANAR